MITFGPALALGMGSTAEYADFALCREVELEHLLEALAGSTESGLVFSVARRLTDGETGLSKSINALDVLAILPVEDGDGANLLLRSYGERCDEILARGEVPVTVRRKGKSRTLNLEDSLIEAQVDWTDSFSSIAEVPPRKPAALLRLRVGNMPSLRPAEIVNRVFGVELRSFDFIRIGCWHIDADGKVREPLDL